jgi:hypothetical protein
MDRSTFGEEAWRNTQVIAEAMGGVAFRESSDHDETTPTSDIAEADVKPSRCTKPGTRKKVFCLFPTIVYVSRHVQQGKVWFDYAWRDSDGKHYISKEDLFSESDYLP